MSPTRSPRRKLLIIVAIVAVCILLVGVLSMALGSKPVDKSTPEAVAQAFAEDLGNRNFKAAYKLTTTSFQLDQKYASWSKNLSNTLPKKASQEQLVTKPSADQTRSRLFRYRLTIDKKTYLADIGVVQDSANQWQISLCSVFAEASQT